MPRPLALGLALALRGGVGSGGGTVTSLANDEFATGSSIDTAGIRTAGAYPWTLQNNASGTTAIASGALSITPAYTATMSPMLATEAMDAGDGAWRTVVSMAESAVDYKGLGLVLRESGTNKQLCYGIATNGVLKLQIRRMTSYTTWVNSYDGVGQSDFTGYLEIVRDGSNLLFLSSEDAVTWTEMLRVAQTVDFTAAPNQVGLWVASANAGGNPSTGVFQYFRKNDRTLPYTVPLVNADAETVAVAAPWTNVTGVLETRTATAHSGLRSFAITGNPGAFENYQEWNAALFASQIDAGGVTATLSGWGQTWTGASSTFRLRLNAYNAGGSSLATNATAYWTPNASYAQKTVALALPALTRKIRLTFEGTTTAADDCWLDDLSLVLS